MSVLDRQFATSSIMAVGIAIGGFLAGHGIARVRAEDRYVTVKGISEREVRADLAIWTIKIVAADNDLSVANAHIQNDIKQVRQFLARHKLDSGQAELQDFAVADAETNQYVNPTGRGTRYVIRQAIVVRSKGPDVVLAASQQVAELVSAGVVLSTNEEYRTGGLTFVFSGLNKLKPEMIAEATARAREGAEQFARDAHSPLGSIRQASQGVFSILPRDQVQGVMEAGQIAKTVRVVSTVEYFLKN